jgi:hypothetical protein
MSPKMIEGAKGICYFCNYEDSIAKSGRDGAFILRFTWDRSKECPPHSNLFIDSTERKGNALSKSPGIFIQNQAMHQVS